MRDGFLNPFRDLSPSHRKEVARQRLLAAEIRKRFEKVNEAYREILTDQRYGAIRAELDASLGEQLHQLVDVAETCAHCAPSAIRVKMLNELLARPLHQLFLEAQRSRYDALPEDLPVG